MRICVWSRDEATYIARATHTHTMRVYKDVIFGLPSSHTSFTHAHCTTQFVTHYCGFHVANTHIITHGHTETPHTTRSQHVYATPMLCCGKPCVHATSALSHITPRAHSHIGALGASTAALEQPYSDGQCTHTSTPTLSRAHTGLSLAPPLSLSLSLCVLSHTPRASLHTHTHTHIHDQD